MRAVQWKKTDDMINDGQTRQFTMAHNKFSDWTSEEKQAYLKLNTKGLLQNGGQTNEHATLTHALRSVLDGDFYGLEYDIGDEGSCDAGFYYDWRTNTCRECREGCVECESRYECIACANEEMTAQNGKCTCPEGPLLDDGTCGTDCGEGYYFH